MNKIILNTDVKSSNNWTFHINCFSKICLYCTLILFLIYHNKDNVAIKTMKIDTIKFIF